MIRLHKRKGELLKTNTPIIIIGRKNKISDSVFNKIASQRTSKFFSDKENNNTTDLNGDFQIENIKTAEKTFQILREEKILNISDLEISNGLNRVIKKYWI